MATAARTHSSSLRKLPSDRPATRIGEPKVGAATVWTCRTQKKKCAQLAGGAASPVFGRGQRARSPVSRAATCWPKRPQNLVCGARIIRCCWRTKGRKIEKTKSTLREAHWMAAATDYTAMYERLGMNVHNHDGLLALLGSMFQENFLSQKERPAKMNYFNNLMAQAHGARIAELLKLRDAGKVVVGAYCTFVPEELIVAVGGACVGLCAGADCATEEAERFMPRNTCSLIKSTLGFKLAGVCPYIEVSSLVVGENTCDGKKKAYEQLPALLNKPFHVIDMPNRRDEKAAPLLKAEYRKFMEVLEKHAGVKITAEALRHGVGVVAAKRAALQRLSDLRGKFDPPPISGIDALLISQMSFLDEPVRFTEAVNALCDELERRGASGASPFARGTPRVLVSGCPMSLPNWKVHHLIETAGAVVVGEESCVGSRGFQGTVALPEKLNDEQADIDAVLDALVTRYLNTNCAVFSPNDARLEDVRSLVKRYKVDGVALYGLHFCTNYLFEGMTMERALEKDGVPALRVETDYSQEDSAQLRTRIEAFIERLKN
eukprot:TRINITY_DN2288_c0_g1_i1.p1 TRINITY_DN2288_c0_g1~~TRINITY_DN2288_c0_g1_i1.p1  ORF type:complete len:547 (+),score=174.48 TRINITY_DN2288_c0_g1_i1:1584-3224(+)